MQKSKSLFFALLRAGLFGTEVPGNLLDNADWQTVYKMACNQTVTGVVAEAIGRLPKNSQPSPQVMQKFMSACFSNMQANARLDSALARLVKTYREQGIEGVLLKGQGIARCYPQIHMRQCGDIDFYVGVDQYDRAIDITRHFVSYCNSEFESYLHYEFKAFGAPIELHRHAAMPLRPWLGGRLERWTSSMLDDRQKLRTIKICGEKVYLPPVLFNAVYIFYHAVYHLLAFEGVGLRQLCDWVLVMHVHHNEINRKELKDTLNELALTNLWRIFGYLAVNYLGLPHEEMPLYSDSSSVRRRANKVLDIIMESGNFGHVLKREAGYTSMDQTLKGRWRRMMWQIRCSRQVFSVAPVDVGGNLLYYLATGPFRVLRRRLKG